MAKKRDKILVMDVEATCWQKEPPQGMTSEIIEIGVTPVAHTDDGYDIGRSVSIVVRPLQSSVSPFCEHLTGWTQEQVDALGVSWADAVARLHRDYKCADAIVAFWGKYDDKMFLKMGGMYDVKYPFNNDYLNVKAMYGAMTGYVCSVGQAVEDLGMEFEGRPHNGADDTRNIAKILVNMLERM